jgi:hypothetical protein
MALIGEAYIHGIMENLEEDVIIISKRLAGTNGVILQSELYEKFS